MCSNKHLLKESDTPMWKTCQEGPPKDLLQKAVDCCSHIPCTAVLLLVYQYTRTMHCWGSQEISLTFTTAQNSLTQYSHHGPRLQRHRLMPPNGL